MEELKKIFTFPLLIREDYYSIVSNTVQGKVQSIVMTSITEEEEKVLDKGGIINIERGNCKFIIKPSDIQAYGEIDFSDDSDDLSYFVNANWFNHIIWAGFSIPSNYDYETHTSSNKENHMTYFDTKRPEIVVQYVHGVLNKPRRTLIFKHQS